MSQVVQEIANQLRFQGVKLRNKTLIKVDNNTLRVSGKLQNVDIKYNQGKDLYDVKVHKINNKTLKVKTCKSKDVYFDDLPNYFNPKITKRMKCGK